MNDTMSTTKPFSRATLFLLGFLLLVIGMVLEFLLAAILPSFWMSVLFNHGGLLVLIIVFFASGAYSLRRGLLGQWRYHYDFLIFVIAGIIFTTGSLMTIFGLQGGHPYLELAHTNPFLLMFLWVFILPPINPILTSALSFALFALAGLQFMVPPRKQNHGNDGSKSINYTEASRWQILLKMVRVDVWLGSLFLVTLAFLILGGPPLSALPLPLYDIWMWVRFLIAIFAVILFNSCVFIVNQLGDIDTDQLHQEKAQLPLSSGQLSRRQGWMIALIFFVAGTLMALLVGIVYLLVLSAIIIFALIYSLPPIRLKARPFLDLAMIGVAFGSWAILVAWVVLFSLPEIPLLLLIGAGFFYAGTHGIHTASDYAADSKAGVNTTAVVLGPKLTARIGIILIGLGLLMLYTAVGFYSHLFWYGLMKYKSILLIIFSGLPVFALLGEYRSWQMKAEKKNIEGIQRIHTNARWVTYILFLTLLAYLMLYVFLFYPVYYPNYNFPWG